MGNGHRVLVGLERRRKAEFEGTDILTGWLCKEKIGLDGKLHYDTSKSIAS
jgi:hypothetical protein